MSARLTSARARRWRGRHRKRQLSTAFDSFSNREHLFGDWGGIRTDLGRLGINLLLDDTSETAGNVAGGTRRALDYADQRALEVDIDWQKLAGMSCWCRKSTARAEMSPSISFSNGATGVQTNEEVLEANYDIHAFRGAYRGINLMPDFQYVIHPNAQSGIPNAVVPGLKAHVEL
ncbi:carbohydrate porin [Acidisoma sp. C75]